MSSRFMVHVRGTVVDSHIVVRLVSHGIGGARLAVLGRLGEGCIGCVAGAGLGRDFGGGVTGGKCAVPGRDDPRHGRASGSRQEPRAN
jgi:hypothetical protein